MMGFRVAKKVRCVSSARFYLRGTLEIGEDTFIGHDVLVAGGDASITVGRNCDLAPRVMLVSGTHHIDVKGSHVAGTGYSSPIIIGDGCWVGAGAIIHGGTVLGGHCIVASGAVVKGSFPDRCVIGGVPAKIIKMI